MLVRGGIASWRRFCCDSLHVGARGRLWGGDCLSNGHVASNWCHNDVDMALHRGRCDIMTTSSVRWVGWTSFFFSSKKLLTHLEPKTSFRNKLYPLKYLRNMLVVIPYVLVC